MRKYYKVYYYNNTEEVQNYYLVRAENEAGALKEFYYRIFTETDYTSDEIDYVNIVEDEDF